VLSRQASPSEPVCNTFWGEAGLLRGTETDSAGILAALDRLEASGRSWCLVGTGGSARAALRAARLAGAVVAVRSRVAERAKAFRETAIAAGLELTDPAACEVVINCTPLGLSERDPLPIARADVPAARVVLDLVYRRGETAWVRALRGAGARAADGREVLVEQGAVAFERWFPGRAAPREVMRAAIHFALG
jgi:shikimate dehydrogenase